jgi:hypothetical protein
LWLDGILGIAVKSGTNCHCDLFATTERAVWELKTGRNGIPNGPYGNAKQKPNRLAANRLREASTAKHKTGKQAWKYSSGTNRKTMETTVTQQHIVADGAMPTCRD